MFKSLSAFYTAVKDMKGRKDNPHQVTAAQLNMYTEAEIRELIKGKLLQGVLPLSYFGPNHPLIGKRDGPLYRAFVENNQTVIELHYPDLIVPNIHAFIAGWQHQVDKKTIVYPYDLTPIKENDLVTVYLKLDKGKPYYYYTLKANRIPVTVSNIPLFSFAFPKLNVPDSYKDVEVYQTIWIDDFGSDQKAARGQSVPYSVYALTEADIPWIKDLV